MVVSIHHPRYVALRQHLKKLRKDANLTQVDLAAKLGDEQSYISKIERGERYVDLLLYVDWCRACGVEPNVGMQWLLAQEGNTATMPPFEAQP